MVTEFLF